MIKTNSIKCIRRRIRNKIQPFLISRLKEKYYLDVARNLVRHDMSEIKEIWHKCQLLCNIEKNKKRRFIFRDPKSCTYTYKKQFGYSLHALVNIKIKLKNLYVQALFIIKLNPIIMFLNPIRIVIIQGVTTTRATKRRNRKSEDRNSISNVPPSPPIQYQKNPGKYCFQLAHIAQTCTFWGVMVSCE